MLPNGAAIVQAMIVALPGLRSNLVRTKIRGHEVGHGLRPHGRV